MFRLVFSFFTYAPWVACHGIHVQRATIWRSSTYELKPGDAYTTHINTVDENGELVITTVDEGIFRASDLPVPDDETGLLTPPSRGRHGSPATTSSSMFDFDKLDDDDDG